jgi:hypothetical protein
MASNALLASSRLDKKKTFSVPADLKGFITNCIFSIPPSSSFPYIPSANALTPSH